MAFFAYSLGEVEGLKLPPTHSQTLALLRDFGLPVCPQVTTARGAEGLLAYFEKIGGQRNDLLVPR